MWFLLVGIGGIVIGTFGVFKPELHMKIRQHTSTHPVPDDPKHFKKLGYWNLAVGVICLGIFVYKSWFN